MTTPTTPTMTTATAVALASKARGDLVEFATFFGCLSLNLQIAEAPERTRTIATDGTYLYINPAWFLAQDERVRETAIAHEAGHCGLLHMYRLEGRDLALANEAADHVVNLLLTEAYPRAKFWPGALMDPRFAGMDFETVYAILKRERDQQEEQARQQRQTPPPPLDECEDNDQEDDQESDDQESDDDQDEADDEGDDGAEESDQEDDDSAQDETDDDGSGTDTDGADDESDGEGSGGTDGTAGDADTGASGDGELDDEGDGDAEQPGGILPPPAKPAKSADDDGTDADERVNSEIDWLLATEAAKNVALKRGDVSSGFAEAVQESHKEPADWRAILREWFDRQLPRDQAWGPFNRRYVARGEYLPGWRRENLPGVVIAMDRSGSQFSPAIMARFARETTAIVQELRPEWIEVVYFDSVILGAERFTPDDEIVFHPLGGGGTAFAPLFAYVEQMDEPPCGVIVLTDLLGENTCPEVYGPFRPEPDYPVLWVTDETSTQPEPWGERITLPEVDYD